MWTLSGLILIDCRLSCLESANPVKETEKLVQIIESNDYKTQEKAENLLKNFIRNSLDPSKSGSFRKYLAKKP